MKVKLFSHDDLDGISSAILGKLTFEDIDIEYCNYDDINKKVKDFILNKEYENYDFVFITDISINEEVAEIIDNTHPENFKEGFNLGEKFQLLDHHPTAEWLNKYWWARVDIMLNDKEKTCGTRMFYDFLIEDEIITEDVDSVLDYVETVRKYDTWQWAEEGDIIPKQYNDIFHIYGRNRFIEKVINKVIHDGYFYLDNEDNFILELEQAKIDKYIKDKNKQIIEKDISGYKAGVVFGEQYHSELGNRLSEMNPHLDFIAIINPSKSVSFRTIKDNIDLGKDVADVFGGGGHKKSAGSNLDNDIKLKILDLVFKN